MSNDVNIFCIHHLTLTGSYRLDGVLMMKYYFHRFPTKIMLLLVETVCGPQERMLILLSFYVSLFGHASLALSASGALSEVCANCSWRTQCWREVYVQRNLQMHESMISSWWLGRLALYIISHFRGFDSVEIKVANCCLVWNHYIALRFSMVQQFSE